LYGSVGPQLRTYWMTKPSIVNGLEKWLHLPIIDILFYKLREESEDEEPVVESKPTKKISNYFRAVNREEKPQKTRVNAFFKERNLEPITSPQDFCHF
jgi:hypothetical protein